MSSEIAQRFRSLRSSARFWSLRYHDERREYFAMRQDTIEPPALSVDRGAMLTAVVEGGYGYCATSDLSVAGLQAALNRATAWAEASRGRSVVPYDPAKFGAPRGEYLTPAGAAAPARSALYDMLAAECKRANADPRIVARYASLSLTDEERVYLTNSGADVRQRFRYTIPSMRVTANEGVVTQSRSLDYEQQGG
ncbi:MAG: PmbA/TldA family metallopeptidase, partial [Burkholderiales bacterium]